jgi:hypothetical protein
MRVYLFLALGLALGTVFLVSASAPAGAAEVQAVCQRYVVGIGGVNGSDCSDEKHPCQTVQHAIDQALDGDRICVADRNDLAGPTIYNETIVIKRSLILDGKWAAECIIGQPDCRFWAVPCAPEDVVLDAGGAGRVIGISGLIKPIIDCFTITGGDAAGQGGDPDGNDAGGGIYSRNAAPIVINNVISGNYGCDTCTVAYGRGGGVYLLDAPATALISDNVVAFNVADESTWGQGGGIMLRDSDAQIRDNAIQENRAGHSAGYGGGIAVWGGAPTINHNDILSNVAGLAVVGNGGGIFAWFTSSLTIEDNLIEGNIALNGTSGSGLTSRGGGIYYQGNPGAMAVIQDNTVYDNTAGRYDDGQGGGLYLEALDPNSVVANNTVELNFAAGDGDGDGGGFYIHDSQMTLSSGHIQYNYGSPGGEGRGGGLFLNDSTVVVSGVIISGNIAGGINGFGRGGGAFISNTLTSLVDNDFVANRAAMVHPTWPGSGGGVEMFNSPGSLFQDNLFDRNKAYVYGGAVFLQASDGVTLAHNTMTGNEAYQGGGGYILYSDDVLFQANTILSNTASGGGGLYLYDSASRLENNVVADNELTSGECAAAINVHGNTADLRHNTIARHAPGTAVLVSGYWGGDGLAYLTNTIVVSHTVGISVTAGNTATLEATLWGDGVWANGLDWGGSGTIVPGTFDLWGAPAFASPSAGNYHITLGSAALNTGIDADVEDDIDGDPRPDWCYFDIGADELLSGMTCYRVYLPLMLRD